METSRIELGRLHKEVLVFAIELVSWALARTEQQSNAVAASSKLVADGKWQMAERQ